MFRPREKSNNTTIGYRAGKAFLLFFFFVNVTTRSNAFIFHEPLSKPSNFMIQGFLFFSKSEQLFYYLMLWTSYYKLFFFLFNKLLTFSSIVALLLFIVRVVDNRTMRYRWIDARWKISSSCPITKKKQTLIRLRYTFYRWELFYFTFMKLEIWWIPTYIFTIHNNV